ncbi:ferric reductase NAD binding domain-containing protein [Aspergillus multicolor]|uniref:ferric reductase NAD binding domain-containing protein n=1 Tax=Aspergillus multicolor TaxID=41759 RepID=UPI003CCE288B
MFVGFIVAVWMHVKDEDKVWVWISVGLLVFDRVLRYVWGAYVNLAVFHPAASRALWMHQASFTPLPGDVTQVTIRNPGLRWTPGQHLFLTCHAIAPLQSHPFTVASIPDDGKIEFLIRSEKGGTRRFYKSAESNDVFATDASPGKPCTVFLEGPYGTLRPLCQFDTVVLIAGGMGATFTMPLLRDLVARWKTDRSTERLSVKGVKSAQIGNAVVRRIRFVWVVRSHKHLAWFETQLQTVLADMDALRQASPDTLRDINLRIHMTDNAEQDKLGHGHSSSETGTETTSNNDREKSAVPDEDALSIYPDSSPRNAGTSERQEQPLSRRQPPALTPHSGRPQVQPLIRTALEEATGESAVVVCGPTSLADDVRRSVVSLSDERAVHKGTGAQGVYLHVENFGW